MYKKVLEWKKLNERNIKMEETKNTERNQSKNGRNQKTKLEETKICKKLLI